MNTTTSTNTVAVAVAAFYKLLERRGLVNPRTGYALVKGIEGEDALRAAWKRTAKGFVRKGARVEVEMQVERLYFGESLVWPLIESV